MTCGFFAAAVTTRAAWEAVPAYPSGERLAEITEAVYPGWPVEGELSADGVLFDVMGRGGLGGHDEDFEYARYDFSPVAMYVPGAYQAWTAETARRLTGAGWKVHDISPTGAIDVATDTMDVTGHRLVASKDGLYLDLEAAANPLDTPAGQFWTSAELTRQPPWWLTATGLAAWIGGGLLAWLVLGWANTRTRSAGGAARATSISALVASLVLLLPATLMGVVAFAAESSLTEPTHQPFWGLSVTWGYGCTWLGAVLLAVALTAAIIARPALSDPAVD
ncbi:hypothetical protein ACTI_70310 [Actinoplanes sp. OR16]|nr:hypothetical protein ACTI_70310 [Actinoplanes sp. OR16]